MSLEVRPTRKAFRTLQIEIAFSLVTLTLWSFHRRLDTIVIRVASALRTGTYYREPFWILALPPLPAIESYSTQELT